MKYLLLIPLLIISLFITLPVSAQVTSTPTLFFCVGNNPQPPCATVPPSQQPSITPSTTSSITPGASEMPPAISSGLNPSQGASPTPDPCAATSQTSVTVQSTSGSIRNASTSAKTKKHKRRDKDHDQNKQHFIGNQGLLQQLIQLLIQFILQLLQKFGVQIPNSNPCPTPTPSAAPSPSGYPSISAAPSSGSSVVTATPTPTKSPQSGGVSALEPSGQAIPTNNVSGWKLLFSDDFAGNVPVGAFSNCSSTQTPQQARCKGLQPYGSYYNDWWAYPTGWPDTAKSGADGNKGAPYGGVYHPEDTVSVSNGAMHIKMYRPKNGGDNHVATLVPIKCMNQKYGRYTERFKVVSYAPGFKSAHLFYQGGFEIDYPENDYGTTISAYTHPGNANFSTSAKWTSWHTTVIEWTANSVKFYMDGKLIGTTTRQVPNIPMDWILQNESSILGPYAANGASSQLDIDWVACYAQG